ncbi:DUF1127 domain-containing protein [Rhodobacterales bacterium HKCCSP123]|nr:DUF1127 domain-containing protein [Rhodobacterales bacterium HKCCSP123]
MATQTLHAPARPLRLAAPVTGFFAALARAVAFSSGAQARYDRVHRLQALSDAELARRGIARDDIVRHVFAEVFAD